MEEYFKIAIKEAKKAFKKNEVPVGAVLIKNGVVIAKSRNNRQKEHNVLGHAEINCIRKAAAKVKDWRLDGCQMYVTLEPCEMCKKIIEESRINEVYFIINKSQSPQKEIGTNLKCVNVKIHERLSIEYNKMFKKFFGKLRN